MKTILLKSRKGEELYALVDDQDFDRLNAFPWYALRVKGSLTIYARTVIDSETVYMHHMVKPPRDGMEIDHDDRSGLNNQSNNLLYATHAANVRNSVASDRAQERAEDIAMVRKIREEVAHVQRVISRGRVYFYHRKSRVRLPDDPTSADFTAALSRLNREHKTA